MTKNKNKRYTNKQKIDSNPIIEKLYIYFSFCNDDDN